MRMLSQKIDLPSDAPESQVAAKIASSLSSLIPCDEELSLIEDATIALEFGFVFFYQSKKFVETQNDSFFLLGNAPLLVDLKKNQIFSLGTALPVESYIAIYRKRFHKRPWHWGFGFIAGLILIVALGLLWLSWPTRRAGRYLLPDNFRGKVVIRFAVPKAPPTPIENGYFVFRLPQSGQMDTSNKWEEGAAYDEYLFDTKNGLVKIPDPPFPDDSTVAIRAGSIGHWWKGQINSQGKMETTYASPEELTFYVGTEKDYRRASGYP